jgi:hypothetical protein
MAIAGLGNFLNSYSATDNKKTKTKDSEEKKVSAEKEEKKTTEQLWFTEENIEDMLKISEESKKKLLEFQQELAESKNAFQMSESNPKDSSGELTQRLVSALGQFQVRQVMGDINKALMSLRIMAGGNSKNAMLARAYIRKLEKVLLRADRKLDDLDKEDGLRSKQTRAEKLNQQKRVDEIKKELLKRELERKIRENSYLLEAMQDKMWSAVYLPNVNAEQDTRLTAQAEAIAAAETGSQSASGGGIAADGGTSGGGDAPGGSNASGDAASGGASDSGAAAVAVEGGGGE